MFGLQWGEILFIAVIAIVLVGPNKLPSAAAQAGRWMREMRTMLDSAKADVVRSAGIDEDALSSLADLHPRRIASSLLAGESLDGLRGNPAEADPAAARVTPNVAAAPRGVGGLDPDAT
jgi:sec-independent protein translocase protein TatB